MQSCPSGGCPKPKYLNFGANTRAPHQAARPLQYVISSLTAPLYEAAWYTGATDATYSPLERFFSSRVRNREEFYDIMPRLQIIPPHFTVVNARATPEAVGSAPTTYFLANAMKILSELSKEETMSGSWPTRQEIGDSEGQAAQGLGRKLTCPDRRWILLYRRDLSLVDQHES
ncbi:unnamed protein product [Tuber aestivum]|uniref:Uncharacterized protein n=1 Tax=Tuber aestivum TaxID=59557 RepID=A0A292Q5A6_9PEZI|nr:unnamed protein product [Tuber aestivum]